MDSTCVICMSKLTSEATCQLMSCKHEFHTSCIQTWLIHSNSNQGCPLCRSPDTICSHGTSLWDHDAVMVKTIVDDLVTSQSQQQTENEIRIQDMKRVLHAFKIALVSDFPLNLIMSELPIEFWTQEDRIAIRVIGSSVLDAQRLYQMHQENEIQELGNAIAACRMHLLSEW
jgi:hypothetical protein